MTASNYPHAIDLDAQLLRRIGTDAIVPADHNNLVDAIEALEATLGTAGDGTEGGGAQAFTTGIADLVGFPSTAMKNPRYPYLPVEATAWYGRERVTPAAWTLAGGLQLSYTTYKGLCRTWYNGSVPALLASADVVGSNPWDLVLAMRQQAPIYETPTLLDVGFSTSGAGDDIDGIRLEGTGPCTTLIRPIINGANAPDSAQVALPNGTSKVWLLHYGGTFYVSVTCDGVVYNKVCPAATSTGTPTKLAMYCRSLGTTINMWMLDFLTTGHVNPI